MTVGAQGGDRMSAIKALKKKYKISTHLHWKSPVHFILLGQPWFSLSEKALSDRLEHLAPCIIIFCSLQVGRMIVCLARYTRIYRVGSFYGSAPLTYVHIHPKIKSKLKWWWGDQQLTTGEKKTYLVRGNIRLDQQQFFIPQKSETILAIPLWGSSIDRVSWWYNRGVKWIFVAVWITQTPCRKWGRDRETREGNASTLCR